ncbi:MAG TPA: LytTR family DNA-binding domain-containing protein [Cyclobacteriaceae bacterium]|jgi:DNA-binding LytR/AlgR family response regulator|nr:LytTR family DNA-binding domain-containing protein [Cyclobacteriaceae bacterium]
MTSVLTLRVLIIEDEVPAAEKLERYLQRYNASISVAAKIQSIKEAVEWLSSRQNEIDLIFMDIQLLDGQSFEIFRLVKIERPVIFITAYNEFALDAFKVKGIDYLLKPVSFNDLSGALQKLEQLRSQLNWSEEKFETVKQTVTTLPTKSFKSRFMVKLGDHIRSITADQIGLLFADGRDVYLITNDNKKFIIDYTLENLEELIDPAIFFRANRSYILNIHFIQDVVVYSNSRLKIIPSVKWDQEIIVSREKVGEFKQWFDGVR